MDYAFCVCRAKMQTALRKVVVATIERKLLRSFVTLGSNDDE